MTYYEITTASGRKYTTSHDVRHDTLTQWVLVDTEDGSKTYIHRLSIESVTERPGAMKPVRRMERKKAEPKEVKE